MSLASYLAANYLNPTADASTKTSRKRKRHTQLDKDLGLTVAEDDPAFPSPFASGSDDNEGNPQLVDSAPAPKMSRFKRLGAERADDNEADALIAVAEQERRERAEAEDNEPTMVITNGIEARRMANGAKAGLQSAKQVMADFKRRQKEERKRMEQSTGFGNSETGETVYRDASGRVVNVAMARAEARRIDDETKMNEVEKREALRGDVQLRQAEELQRELEGAKGLTVGRNVEDEAMNHDLRGKVRWNDPMAGVIVERKDRGKPAQGTTGVSQKKKRSYQAGFEPNRYGVAPGWRWDGVDRSNGFERKWWAARNERGRKGRLEYAWEVDD